MRISFRVLILGKPIIHDGRSFSHTVPVALKSDQVTSAKIKHGMVVFAELSFDALPIAEDSEVFERVEHEGMDGSRQVTFVYDDFCCHSKSNRQCETFEEFEANFRNEIETKFKKEILRLGRLGSFPRLSFSIASGNVSCSNTEVSREMICMLAKKGWQEGQEPVNMSK